MSTPHSHLFFSLLFLTSLTAALPVLPQPDTVPLQSFNSPLSAVIPAFPEQSDVASPSSCHLSLPADLTAVSSSCSSIKSSLCCPALAAALYSAYSASALSLPAAKSLPADLPADLPDLPDDPESCSGEVEKQLVSRGLHLPRVNATCDAAYCFCGVRLRRLTCAGGAFVADGPGGRWAPTEYHRRRMETECRSPGVAGCTRCLHVLNQLNGNMSASARNDVSECQLIGLTWLLSKNTTLYLPTATSVLGALMADPGDDVGPTTCSLPSDEMPFAVGAGRINGDGESSAVTFAVGVYRLLPFLVFLFFLISEN